MNGVKNMKKYQHILVPYDASPMSDEALKVAQSLARTYQAPITLLFVNDKSKQSGFWKALSRNESAPFLSSQTNVDVAPLPNPPIEEKHQSQTEDPTDYDIENEVFATAKGLMSEDIIAKYEIVEGEATKEIIKYTLDFDVDLIVMGFDGQNGSRKLSNDHITNKIANDTKCSLFIVK